MRVALLQGQYDTRHRENKGNGTPNPLYNVEHDAIDYGGVWQLVHKPQNIPEKNLGLATMPVEFTAPILRSGMADLTGAKFWYLSVDLDSGDYTKWQVVQAVSDVVGPDTTFVVWSSFNSWNPEKGGAARWAVMVPMTEPLSHDAYFSVAEAFLQLLEDQGLKIEDRSSAQRKRLRFLPNSGPWGYDFHAQQGSTYDLSSVHYDLASSLYTTPTQRTEFFGKTEGSRSFLAAFARKHDTEELLTMYGFTSKNGIDWHWVDQTSDSFATKLDEDGRGWVTSSDSVSNRLGSKNGDGFDLYVQFSCNGNRESASMYAAQCLKDEDAPFIEHGRELWSGAVYCSGQPVSPEALREYAEHTTAEHAEAVEALAEIKAEERNKWSGEWLKEVPVKLANPSRLEWLAWHAPGGIGEAVRAKSVQTSRHTIIPLMLGALSFFTHLGQGKFVSRTRQHVTPCALMIFQVGSSGSSKGDGTGTFYDLLGTVKDHRQIAATRVKTFASGQSLTDYLMHTSHNVMMVQNEGGADRSSGRGNSHFEGLMAGVTDTYTAFVDGVERTHTKSDDKVSTNIAHPTVSALQSSTPNKLFSTIGDADGESGWLGRFLFIALPATLTNKTALPDCSYPQELITRINSLVDTCPPLPGQTNPNIWYGKSGIGFHCIHFTPEALDVINAVTDKYDALGIDDRRTEVEKAIYNRAAEAVGRLATVAGIAKNMVIDAECATWASMVVEESVAYVTSKMEDSIGSDDSDTPASKVRLAIVRQFKRADADVQVLKRLSGQRDMDKVVNLSLSCLRRAVKNACRCSARVVSEEFEGMIQDGELVKIPMIALSGQAKELVKLLGNA